MAKQTKQKTKAAAGAKQVLPVETIKVQVTGLVARTGDTLYPFSRFQNLVVRIYQARLNGESLLQAAAVSETGAFEMELNIEKGTTIMGRLYLTAADGTQGSELLLAESGPHCPGSGVVVLGYQYDPSKSGAPLYVAVKDAIAPHLGALQLTALTEKQKEQLCCIAGVNLRLLNRLIQASRLEKEMQLAFNVCNQNNQSSTKAKNADAAYFKKAASSMKTFTNQNIAEAILFALIQNDNSMELHEVLTLSAGQFAQQVSTAVAENIIAPTGDMQIINLVFIFLRNCMLFNSLNDNRYYDAKLIALTKLDMSSKSILLDHTIEAGGLKSFLSAQDQITSSSALATA